MKHVTDSPSAAKVALTEIAREAAPDRSPLLNEQHLLIINACDTDLICAKARSLVMLIGSPHRPMCTFLCVMHRFKLWDNWIDWSTTTMTSTMTEFAVCSMW